MEESVFFGVFDDFAFVEEDDAGGDFFGEIELMGDDDESEVFGGEAADESEDVFDGLGVEGGSWLVEEKDFWVEHHGTNDGDALLLTAGETGGEGVGLVEEVD